MAADIGAGAKVDPGARQDDDPRLDQIIGLHQRGEQFLRLGQAHRVALVGQRQGDHGGVREHQRHGHRQQRTYDTAHPVILAARAAFPPRARTRTG